MRSSLPLKIFIYLNVKVNRDRGRDREKRRFSSAGSMTTCPQWPQLNQTKARSFYICIITLDLCVYLQEKFLCTFYLWGFSCICLCCYCCFTLCWLGLTNSIFIALIFSNRSMIKVIISVIWHLSKNFEAQDSICPMDCQTFGFINKMISLKR